MAGKILEEKMVSQIQIMHKQGLKIKEIARNLSLSKNTVKKYLRNSVAKNNPEPEEPANHYSQVIRENSDRFKTLEAFFPEVETLLARTGFTLNLIWQKYKLLHPDGYGHSQFCYYYQKYRSTKNAVMHFEHDYGDKLYLDYAGEKISYVVASTGEIIECEFFVAVMGGSQETFACATPTQQKADFIECVQDALEYYQGVPKVLVPDNLKSAVTKANRYDPALNNDFLEMANHYHCAVMPARGRKPRDKSLAIKASWNAMSASFTQEFTPSCPNRHFFHLERLMKPLPSVWRLTTTHCSRERNAVEGRFLILTRSPPCRPCQRPATS